MFQQIYQERSTFWHNYMENILNTFPLDNFQTEIYQSNTGTVLETTYCMELKGVTLDEVAQVIKSRTEEEEKQRILKYKQLVITININN